MMQRRPARGHDGGDGPDEGGSDHRGRASLQKSRRLVDCLALLHRPPASAARLAVAAARITVTAVLLAASAHQYIGTLAPIAAPELINDELPRLSRQLAFSVLAFVAAWVWAHATSPAPARPATGAAPAAGVRGGASLRGTSLPAALAAIATAPLVHERAALAAFAAALLALDAGSTLRSHGAYCWTVWICISAPLAGLHVAVAAAVRRWGARAVAAAAAAVMLASLPARAVALARYRDALRAGVGVSLARSRADGWGGCEWDAASRVTWPVYDLTPRTHNVWAGPWWCPVPADAPAFAVTHAALTAPPTRDAPGGDEWMRALAGAGAPCPAPAAAAYRLPAAVAVSCPPDRSLWLTRLPQADALPDGGRSGEEMQGAAVLPLARRSRVDAAARGGDGAAVITLAADDPTEALIFECIARGDAGDTDGGADVNRRQAAADAAEHVYVPRPSFGDMRRLARWWPQQQQQQQQRAADAVGGLVAFGVQGEHGLGGLLAGGGLRGGGGGGPAASAAPASASPPLPENAPPPPPPPLLPPPPDVVIVIIDALSAPHTLRRLPRTTAVLADLPRRGYAETHQLLRFHAMGFSTGFSVVPLYTGGTGGAPGARRPGDETLFEWAARARGYATSVVVAMCEDMGTTYTGSPWHAGHDATPRYCAPAAHPLVSPLGNWAGPYSFRPRCVRGRHVHARALDDALAFWRTYGGRGGRGRVPRLLAVHLMDAHEGTGEVLALADAAIAAFLQEISAAAGAGRANATSSSSSASSAEGDGGPVLFVGSDHGLHMGLTWLLSTQGRLEHQMPLGVLAVPDALAAALPPGVPAALRHNSNALTTAADVYWTLRALMDAPAGAERYDARAAEVAAGGCATDAPDWRAQRRAAGLAQPPPLGPHLLAPLPEARACADAGVPGDLCACH